MLQQLFFAKKAAIGVALLVLQAGAVFAAVPDTPEDFTFTMKFLSAPKGVLLEWSASDEATGYKVYFRTWNFASEEATGWAALDATVQTSLFVERDVLQLAAFQVTAVNDEGESVPTAPISGALAFAGPFIVEGDMVQLLKEGKAAGLVDLAGTRPPAQIIVGDDFEYDANAVGELFPTRSQVAPVRYTLAQGPAGMTIDARTGKMTWTADREGLFTIEINAEIPGSDQRSSRSWDLEVSGGVVSVNTSAAASDLVVFPNPATDRLTLRLNSLQPLLHLIIASATGQTITMAELHPAPGENTISVNTKSLPSGSYFLRLSSYRAGALTVPFTVIR